MMWMFLLLSMLFCMCIGALMFSKELRCKASDTGIVLSWLAWLFSNLNEDFEWPLSALKLLVLHAEDCISTMMRSQRQLTQEEWFIVVSSGNMFLKGWVQLRWSALPGESSAKTPCISAHHRFPGIVSVENEPGPRRLLHGRGLLWVCVLLAARNRLAGLCQKVPEGAAKAALQYCKSHPISSCSGLASAR